jgi:hypothetical protein
VRYIEAFPQVIVQGSTLKTSDSVGTGAFDGRWLVWTQIVKLQSSRSSATSVMAWDSAAGAISVVSKRFYPRPVTLIPDPAQDASLIAWAEDPKSSADPLPLHLYSLTTDESTPVLNMPRQDSFGGAFFWDGSLILDLARKAGVSRGWHLEAVSLATGGPAFLPSALGSLQGLTSVAGSSTYVFGTVVSRRTSAVGHSKPFEYTIVVLRRGAKRSTDLVRNSAEAVIGGSQFGHYLTWEEGPSHDRATVFVADLDSGAYAAFPAAHAEETHSGFGVESALGGGATLVTVGSIPSAGGGRSTVGVLRLDRLTSMGGCHR